jgi:uncharacterized membrane protein YqiK
MSATLLLATLIDFKQRVIHTFGEKDKGPSKFKKASQEFANNIDLIIGYYHDKDGGDFSKFNNDIRGLNELSRGNPILVKAAYIVFQMNILEEQVWRSTGVPHKFLYADFFDLLIYLDLSSASSQIQKNHGAVQAEVDRTEKRIREQEEVRRRERLNIYDMEEEEKKEAARKQAVWRAEKERQLMQAREEEQTARHAQEQRQAARRAEKTGQMRPTGQRTGASQVDFSRYLEEERAQHQARAREMERARMERVRQDYPRGNGGGTTQMTYEEVIDKFRGMKISEKKMGSKVASRLGG